MTDFVPVFNLSTTDGANGFRLDGAANDRIGRVLAGIGDINGDGFDDIAIGAQSQYTGGYYPQSRALAYIIYGNDTQAAASQLDESALDGATNGFVMEDFETPSYSVSWTVFSAMGDTNGDGFDEFHAGAETFAPYVNGGSTLLRTETVTGRAIFPDIVNGGGPNYYNVSDISFGDINGDGFDDLITGNRDGYTSGGYAFDPRGVVSIGFGAAPGSSGGFLDIAGTNFGDSIGRAVSGQGDINGDGFDDLVFTGKGPAGFDGSVFVVFGSSTFTAPDLTALDGTDGFRLDAEPSGNSLRSLEIIGDFNGDGFDDLVIGSSLAGTAGGTRAYLVFGQASGFAPTEALGTLSGADGFIIEGVSAFDVGAVGDVNGDGFDDVRIGSSIVFGTTATITTPFDASSLDGDNGFLIAHSLVLNDIEGIGDFNGDGLDDIIVGVSTEDMTPDPGEGATYVVYGARPDAAVTRVGSEIDQTIFGSDLGDVLQGLGGNDTLFGERGNDLLEGGTGNDRLDGGFSADILLGGVGADRLIGGFGDDVIDGGSGSDTAEFGGFGGGIAVNLNITTAQNTGGAGTDTITNVEHLIGGDFNDRFTGNTGINILQGRDGSDFLFGIGGNDVLIGNQGNDNLQGGNGNDVLNGGLGRDIQVGGSGADRFVFAEVEASVVGGQRDRINDFEVGVDTIDLSGIDAISGGADDAFSFVGNSAFSGSAGELGAIIVGGFTRVQGDIDGDSIADFEIILVGGLALGAGDFDL